MSSSESLRGKSKLILLGIVLLALILIGKFSGLDRFFSLEQLQVLVDNSGSAGILIYVGLFTLGTFLHIPGMIFIIAAFILFGQIHGGLIAYAGAITALTVNFLVIRKIGGGALAGIQKPWLQKVLGRLENRPFSSIVMIRSIFWISPPINYTLALTPIRSRHFISGTAVGLLLPFSLLTIASFFWLDNLVRLIS